MKIIIIGAGIAGLSSYLFLNKHLIHNCPDQHQIKVYEAYDIRRMKYDAPGATSGPKETVEPLFTPKVIGNAIGIGKNGLSVISRIDERGELARKYIERGNNVSKWKMGTARGWKIIDASVQSAAKDDKVGSDQPVNTVMIARQVAWEVLRDEVLNIDNEAVAQKRIEKITTREDGTVLVKFTDETEDVADLLIGADGLKSIVRRTMFVDHDDHYPQSWVDSITRKDSKKKDYITPHYEGLTGLGGFVPSSVLKGTGYQQEAMAITFGPNGFFGHGYIGAVDQITDDSAPLAAWWSTIPSKDPHPWQTSDTGASKDSFDREAAVQELLKRHRFSADPAIQAILDYLEKHESIEHSYPTYTTPELPTWSQGSNMVLVGDAAHALQPSSGQGACQALEDAEALALLLKHYLHSPHVEGTGSSQAANIEKALHKYVELRKPRLAKIYKRSQKMSSLKMQMNIVEEYLMYSIIWVASRMRGWKAYNDELFEYDVPAEVARIVKD